MSSASAASIRILVDGNPVDVAPGTTVAAAIAAHSAVTRRSVTGSARGPLCGMGICFECRVEIDGTPHIRSCMVACREGMNVRTQPQSLS
ncbi:MAG: hypothetical protein AMXMBFR58_08970 [Phycisphaerae bacterium]